MLPHAKGEMNLAGKRDSGCLWDTACCHRTEAWKWLGVFCRADLARTKSWKRLSFLTEHHPCVRFFVHHCVLLHRVTPTHLQFWNKDQIKTTCLSYLWAHFSEWMTPVTPNTSIHVTEHHWLQEAEEGTPCFAHSTPSPAPVHLGSAEARDMLSQSALPAAHRKHSC